MKKILVNKADQIKHFKQWVGKGNCEFDADEALEIFQSALDNISDEETYDILEMCRKPKGLKLFNV